MNIRRCASQNRSASLAGVRLASSLTRLPLARQPVCFELTTSGRHRLSRHSLHPTLGCVHQAPVRQLRIGPMAGGRSGV
jgi:hypothetical protein